MKISKFLTIVAFTMLSFTVQASDPETAMKRHDELLEHISMGTLKVINEHRRAYRVAAGLSACGLDGLSKAVTPSNDQVMDNLITYTVDAGIEPGRGLEVLAGVQSAIAYHQLGFKDAVEVLLAPATKKEICASFTEVANKILAKED